MSQEQTFIWRVWRYSSCLIAGSGVYEEYICCWLGRSLPVISLQQTCAQIQTDAAGSDFWWFKKKREKTTTKQLFSNRAVSTMQEWAIHPHRPTIPKCLSDDSSNHVNSILWFLYRSSSRTSSTVCLWCIFAFLLWFFLLLLFFVFLEWYWWAVHFPGLLAPEGSKLQISVVSGQFHLKSVGVDEA